MKKIAIITAMQSEYNAILEYVENPIKLKEITTGYINNKEVVVILSGIGKVSSAIATAQAILKYEVDLVINSGTSGSLDPKIKVYDVIMANEVGYHDVDVTAFGHEIGKIPGLEKKFKLKRFNINGVKEGLIVSGDQFVSKKLALKIKQNFPTAIAVEMEAAGIAQTAAKFNVDCTIIKSISDETMKDNNQIDYKKFEIKAAKTNAIIINKILRGNYE